jgi:hypothetical protein
MAGVDGRSYRTPGIDREALIMKTIGLRRVGLRAACLGALALAALVGRGAFPPSARAAGNVDSVTADWPDDSRIVAKALAEQLGPPRRSDGDMLTWYGPGAWKRTVVYRSDPDGNIIEQAVDYRYPAGRFDPVWSFDKRVRLSRRDNELIVRSNSLATNNLLANLGHEVASGFRSASSARDFYQQQVDLHAAGKSSSYMDGLRFESERRLTTVPWTSPAQPQPLGKPWDTRGTPWVVPGGSHLPPNDAVQP